MIAMILARLRCVSGRHAWSVWSSWSHAGRGAFVRTRHCGDCGKLAQEQDG